MLAKIVMKPGEARLRTIDYSDWLQATEIVTGAAILDVQPVTVPPLTVIADVLSDSQVSVYVLNGLEDTDYTVSVQATTTIPLVTGDVNEQRIDCLGVAIGEDCS